MLEAEGAEPTASAPVTTEIAPDLPPDQLSSAENSSIPAEVLGAMPPVHVPEVPSSPQVDLSLAASVPEAPSSRNELDSPRQQVPVVEPFTPAAEGPPRVPPPTPIDVTEANQSEAVPLMSPSVIYIPSPLQSRPEGMLGSPPQGLGSETIFDLCPPAPGVIYEVPMPQA